MARTPRVPGEQPAEAQADAESREPQQATGGLSEKGKAKLAIMERPAHEAEAKPGLPDAADIDPTKLRRAVMTRQGWVCPAASPAPPVRE